MKKLLPLLLASSLLAYQPANPPMVVTAPRTLQPEAMVGPLAALVVGGAVVGGGLWVGIKLFKAVKNIEGIRNRQMTNGVPADVVFTLQGSFDGEESGQ